MKSPKSLLWIVLGCVGTIAAASAVLIFLLFNSTPEDEEHLVDLSESASSQTELIQGVGTQNLDVQSIEAALVSFVGVGSTFQRNQLLFSLLEDANEYDLLEILRVSEDIERNSYRTAIQTATIRKFATIDPNHALHWISKIPRVRRDPLLEGVFHEWSLSNLDESVQGAKSLIGSDRSIALVSILSTRSDLPATVLLDIGRELEIEEIALQYISSVQTLRLLKEPSSAWEALANDNLDDSIQLDSLKLVASAWKDTDGFDVLLHASALFPHTQHRSALSSVVEAVAGTEIEAAFSYLRMLRRQERGELPVALAMVAARTDPQVAIEQISLWSDEPILLQLQQAVTNTWARTDPRSMLEQFEQLPQSTHLEAAEIAFTRLAYESPEEAIEYMKEVRGHFRRWEFIALIIAQQWSHTDPEAALEWSLAYSEQDSGLRRAFVQRVFRSFVSSDPHRALQLVQDLDELTSTRIHVTQADYDVVWELTRMGRIDDAIALLPQLEEHPRHFAIDDLGHALVRAGDPFTAVELGIDIPSLSAPLMGPATYFTRIFDAWATRDPQQLFQTLESFTSPVLRAMAARELISRQETTPTLTKDELESAQVMLNERPITGNVLKLELEMRAEEGLIDLDKLVVPDEWLE